VGARVGWITALLLFGIGAAWGKPAQRLELIWNQSPPPDRAYVFCDFPGGAEYCVPRGKWWGVCNSKESGRGEITLKPGEITLAKDQSVTFSGCPHYHFLLTDELVRKNGYLPTRATFWLNACVTEIKKSNRAAYTMGKSLYRVEINSMGTLRYSGTPLPTTPPSDLCADLANRPEGMREMKIPSIEGLTTVGTWNVVDISDLNGSGNPEILLAADLKDHPNESVALLVSVGNELKVIAKTVTLPTLSFGGPEGQTVRSVRLAWEECQHWGGEEPYDAARAKEIATEQKKSCEAFTAQLKKALQRYPTSAVLKQISKESSEAGL
jgi:hypothetical protein